MFQIPIIALAPLQVRTPPPNGPRFSVGDLELKQEQNLKTEGRFPNAVVACVGGGSNAMGILYPFAKDTAVKLIGVEAAGHGIRSKDTAATIVAGRVGVLHGFKSYLHQSENGQVLPTHSISAGLNYPGVGPSTPTLKTSGRADYYGITDLEALAGFDLLTQAEIAGA